MFQNFNSMTNFSDFLKNPGFISDCADLNDKEIFQFIVLLSFQYQKGDISKRKINILIPDISFDVLMKFKLNKRQFFFNQRLQSVMNKKITFSKEQIKSF